MDDDKYNNIMSRIQQIEQHIINLIFPIQNIEYTLRNSERINVLIELLEKPLNINDKRLSSLDNSINTLTESFKKINIDTHLAEIKFLSKRLVDVERCLKKIKEDGINKNIHLDISCEGYTLVKKQKNYDETEPVEESKNNHIEKLIESLPKRIGKYLVLKYGLLDQKQHSDTEIAKILGISVFTVKNYKVELKKRFKRKKLKDLVLNTGHQDLINLL